MRHQAKITSLKTRLCGLYVITDEQALGRNSPSNHVRIARAAIAGGAQILQFRAKKTPPPLQLEIAQELRALTQKAGVLFFINDLPELARKVNADGVHLGPDDGAPQEARVLLGEEKLIGVSCNSAAEARAALQAGADYIGAGAVFSTSTKSDAGAPIGVEQLRTIIEATPLPVAAIGGVNLQNIAELDEAGAAMACVISAITGENTETAMENAARQLRERFEAARIVS